MAQENAEKVAKAKKAAADAERRAAARQLEDNLAERMEKLLQAAQRADYVREARLTLGPDSMNPPDALIASGRVLALEEPAPLHQPLAVGLEERG